MKAYPIELVNRAVVAYLKIIASCSQSDANRQVHSSTLGAHQYRRGQAFAREITALLEEHPFSTAHNIVCQEHSIHILQLLATSKRWV